MTRIVVITGPSGAGKTLALHSFEDAGYYAADNLPPRLLPGLALFCRAEGHSRAAVVIDARCGSAFEELPAVLQELDKQGLEVELLFLESSEEALIRRYKEMRRPHPLLTEQTEGGIMEAIQAERLLLRTARGLADRTLDTSTLSPAQLREAIYADCTPEGRPGLMVTITSFGFKHGLPMDSDLVFDVRFLANPHYIPALKPLDGREPEVADFVHHDERADVFLQKMADLVRFALPQYQQEGKAYLNIAIGCTGGKHRSVVLAQDLAQTLRQDGYRLVVHHRDATREKALSSPPVTANGSHREEAWANGSIDPTPPIPIPSMPTPSMPPDDSRSTSPFPPSSLSASCDSTPEANG